MSISSCTQGTNKHYHLENKNRTKQLAQLPFSSTPAPFISFPCYPSGRGGGSGQEVSFCEGFLRSTGRSFAEKYLMGYGTPWAVRYHLQE
jgi:hypothetical protein